MPLAVNDLSPPAAVTLKSVVQSPQARFQRLIHDIQAKLGSNDGIVSSNAVRLKLESLLQDYRSDEEAWQGFAFRDPSQAFTRNLVDKGNGNYNLILKGTLTETRYAWPDTTKPGPMQVTQSITFNRDQVTYMADTLGLHKISNPDPKEYAVSLH
ncbi:MAG: hypothetical protein Q9225_004964, partial [Loekoesia sp. 1 TL-2023]